MSAKFVVGVIGLGVGNGHLKAYLNEPDVRVKLLCDFSQDKIGELKKLYPHIICTKEPNDIICDPEINIVSIASYDNFHADQIVNALNNGKHVFAEKPICLSSEEMERIYAAVLEHPALQFSSNLILRKCPRFLSLKKKIEEGLFGQIYFAEGDYLYGRIHKVIHGWRGEIPYYSVLLGGAIHLIDLLLWLSGDRVVEVSAMGNQLVSRGSQFKYNDFSVGLLKMRSGAIFKISSNFGSVGPHFHDLRVFGTQGTYFHERDVGKVYLDRYGVPQGPLLMNEPYPGMEKGDLIPDFLMELRDRKTLRVINRWVFDAMSVCFALEKSQNTCQTVKVDYLYQTQENS